MNNNCGTISHTDKAPTVGPPVVAYTVDNVGCGQIKEFNTVATTEVNGLSTKTCNTCSTDEHGELLDVTEVGNTGCLHSCGIG